MRAKDLRTGMTVETAKGPKEVRRCTVVNENSQRIAFADGEICLCPPDQEFEGQDHGHSRSRD